MKIGIGIVAVLVVVGSVLVTIAALFPPKEYKGDDKASKSDVWDKVVKNV